ncbi:MAG TPA: hypothetical protein VJ020_10875, partial [Anaerolineales bacterium]|nr:hypothetical protein [Anaerolineales bacterium]
MLQTRTRDAFIFQIGLAIFLLAILLIILIPFWRVVVTAFVPLDIYTREGVPFFLPPTQWTLEAFRQLLGHSLFPRAALNSVIITLCGTAISLILTVPLAYGLSTPTLPGRRVIMVLILFTFLFHPGLVPVYLLVTGLKLTNNYLAVILPPAVSV